VKATLPEERGVADLARDVLRAVLGILRSTARIFGLEARGVVRHLAGHAALLAVSAFFVAAGAVFLLGALALGAEALFHLPRWASLAIVGAAALVAGALGVRSSVRGLSSPDLTFPETLAELGKDVDALAGPRERP
jgi:hypothetical protein